MNKRNYPRSKRMLPDLSTMKTMRKKLEEMMPRRSKTKPADIDFAIEVLQEAIDAGLVECNCGYTVGEAEVCDGTCTYSRMKQAIAGLKDGRDK